MLIVDIAPEDQHLVGLEKRLIRQYPVFSYHHDGVVYTILRSRFRPLEESNTLGIGFTYRDALEAAVKVAEAEAEKLFPARTSGVQPTWNQLHEVVRA